ncbi:ABC transporter ATP-binding protein [Pseudohalocynthiibacter sp. F2068]|uniref:ABC transporter ATP-binding protein n=1 Tax=Pseudohalocynthiibacter sp. F2068 TaxID=2926418 RepID=UPI001FF17BD4|nr:ABC transporter ATP-binding protein [Pseudohalocynthiibacter sp. F2068]MCK0103240.1 ABC transporter ATP-binding protein [Pseudohalocynthiibacter sp. F2068]
MLEVEGLTVAYGAILAVQNVSLSVLQGEIVVLLGPNGAGKTSTLMAISGVAPRKAGKITLDGTDLGQGGHTAVRRGVVHVPEGRMIFGDLSVRENLMIGAEIAKRKPDLDLALDWFPDLRSRLSERARALSGGQLQMLAIGRALMSRPKLLMLDEPTLGLAPRIVEDMFRKISKLSKHGVSILLVEQHLTHSLDISDRGYVLANGCIVAEGAAYELKKDPALTTAYLAKSAKRIP